MSRLTANHNLNPPIFNSFIVNDISRKRNQFEYKLAPAFNMIFPVAVLSLEAKVEFVFLQLYFPPEYPVF